MPKQKVRCKSCGEKFYVGDTADGAVTCPHCNTSLTLAPGARASRGVAGLVGKTLGEYTILEVLNKGGMGVIYKARQKRLERLVAVKVLPTNLSRDAKFVTRFEREARAAASVTHPNIIQILHIGEERGLHYIAMELVEGDSLAALIGRDGPLEQPQALRLFKQVASALSAAHARGIVHRDIKPSNVLINHRGNAKVVDFGIAKRPDTDVNVTATGAALGTPLYMPPEIGRGGKDLDARADLYSLGATFYHALSGRPPFEADTPAELIVKHTTERAPALRSVAPRVDRELAKIIDRLLRKNPDSRYDSAEALLTDLESIHLAAPDVDRDAPTLEMKPKREKETPSKPSSRRMLALACGVLALMVIEAITLRSSGCLRPRATVAIPQPGDEATPGGDQDSTQPTETNGGQGKAGQLADPPRVVREGGWTSMFDGKSLKGWKLLDEKPWFDPGPVKVEKGVLLFGKEDLWTQIAWDGEFPTCDYELSLDAMRVEGDEDFCTINFPVGSSGCRSIVEGWGGRTSALQHVDDTDVSNDTAQSPEFASKVWYSFRVRVTAGRVTVWVNDKTMFDVTRQDRRFGNDSRYPLKIYTKEVTALRNIRCRRLEYYPEQAPKGAVSLDEVVVPADARVDWNDTGLYLTKGQTYTVAPAGTWGAAADRTHPPEGTVGLAGWAHALPGARECSFIGRVGRQGRPFFIGEGLTFKAEDYGTLYLRINDTFHLDDNWGTLRVTVKGPLRVAPDAPLLSRFTDVVKTVTVNAQTFRMPTGFQIRRGDRLLLTAEGDWQASYTWDVTGPIGGDRRHGGRRLAALTASIGLHGRRFTVGDLHLLDANQSGELYLGCHDHALGDNRGNVKVTIVRAPDMERVLERPRDPDFDCQPVATLTGHKDRVGHVAFSSDGRQLVSSSVDNTARVWDVRDRRCTRTLSGHKGNVRVAAFSPNGKLIATGGADNQIRIWDAASGDCLRTIAAHYRDVIALAWLDDGKRLVSGGAGTWVRIWDAETGKRERSLSGHTSHVWLDASPQHARIVTADGNGWIGTWDAKTGERKLRIFGRAPRIEAVAISRDGGRFVTADNRDHVRVWSVANGACLTTCTGVPSSRGVVFSPDGTWVASCTYYHSIEFWNAATGQLLRSLEAHDDEVQEIAVSPDGKLLASASFDRTLILWAVGTRAEVAAAVAAK